jgi:hypothetical protein
MSEVAAAIRKDILDVLARVGDPKDDPAPPSSYAMASMEVMAMSVFDNNRRLTNWMRERGLDPLSGPDALLGVGLLLLSEVEKNPRPEPAFDDDDEFPDDHHH